MATRTRKASTRWQASRMTAEQREAHDAKRREAGKAKAAAALDRLDAAIERIAESDEAFAEYLRISGKMHGYSFGNRLLIWAQRPDAGMVAGFHRWVELGRPVRKGAKGIQILAPMVVKQDADASDRMADAHYRSSTIGADGKVRKVIGFRVSYVFSIRDTDGPEVSVPSPVLVDDDSDRAKALLGSLLAQSARQSIPVAFELMEGSRQGYYSHAEHRIGLREGVAAGQSCKTLIHELAHHYAGKDSRADGEIVAESAAFVVASHYGLDTSGYSAPYVAGWAKGDVKRFRGLLDRIMKVAGALIDDGETCPRCLGAGCEECR